MSSVKCSQLKFGPEISNLINPLPYADLFILQGGPKVTSQRFIIIQNTFKYVAKKTALLVFDVNFSDQPILKDMSGNETTVHENSTSESLLKVNNRISVLSLNLKRCDVFFLPVYLKISFA